MPRHPLLAASSSAALLAALLAFGPVPTLAADASSPPPADTADGTQASPQQKEAAPDPHDIPVLSNLIANGYLPRYLAFDRGLGFHVWFVRQQNDAPAIFYTAPSGLGVIAPGQSNLIGGDYYVVKDGKIVNRTLDYYLAAKTILASEGVMPKPQGPAEPQTASAQPAASLAQRTPSPPQQQAAANAAAANAATPTAVSPHPTGVNGATLLDAFENKAAWIEIGKPSAPLIYAVVDPECHYCHEFWAALDKFVADGSIRVRLIPVATLNNNGLSETEATAILASADPAAAWRTHYFPPTDSAAIVRGAKMLKKNMDMWEGTLHANELGGVPLILLRRKDGTLGYHLGMAPENVPALVEHVAPIATGQ